jgi:hypothetical protein
MGQYTEREQERERESWKGLVENKALKSNMKTEWHMLEPSDFGEFHLVN